MEKPEEDLPTCPDCALRRYRAQGSCFRDKHGIQVRGRMTRARLLELNPTPSVAGRLAQQRE